MALDYAALQSALKDRGFDKLGISGSNADGVDGDWGPRSIAELKRFQASVGLPADGVPNQKTLKALGFVNNTASVPTPIPNTWLVPAAMKGIVVHWTAGANMASSLDKHHYHILIEKDGSLVRGLPKISDNSLSGMTQKYAAHTWNCNSGMIGVSLCCMAGASLTGTKSKITAFDSGSAPMTKQQWAALPPVLAQLCQAYGIPIGRKSVLSHAEVEGTLGIKQKDKWDIAALSFEGNLPAPGKSVHVNALAIGDRFRSAASALI